MGADGSSSGAHGAKRASHASAGGVVTPGSSQPGTPLSGALAAIASCDGSGSEGGGGDAAAAGHGECRHARSPSRLRAGGATSSGAVAEHDGRGAVDGSRTGREGPLERLRLVAGNRRCVDCGSSDPDWASLNLGVLLCIECSGVHRQLGVQYSKVRSCTLDVRVWEPPVIAVFEAIGNEHSNSVWEACLSPPLTQAAAAAPRDPTAAAAAAARGADSWVMCCGGEESGEEEEGGAAGAGGRHKHGSASGRRPPPMAAGDAEAAAAATAAAGSPSAPRTPAPKPSPTAPLADKARFIQDKYVARAFAATLPREQAQAKLWDAVAASDVRAALAALAAGADINAAYRTPRAQKLVGEAWQRAAATGGGGGGSGGSSGDGSAAGSGAAAARGPSPTACGTVTVLHLVAVMESVAMAEFLLQNGASWLHTDAHGCTPLHYAVLYSNECAKLLMRRSGSGGELQRCRDAKGRTPMDLLMATGRVTDEELFVLLSS